jgi:ubiquinol-cytochrome c reductase cytochrome b subunit
MFICRINRIAVFSPYFLFKDLVTIFMAFIALCLFVFFIPNLLGDSENYVIKESML